MGRIGSTAVALLATLLVASGCTQEPPERGAIAPVADREDAPVEPSPPPPGPAERLGLRTGWGPTADELDRAARLVSRLRLPELAGQVIVADWRGTGAPTEMVRRLHLGGVIAFADNVDVDAPDPGRQRPAPPHRRPRVAALPGRRPGGWHRRAGARPRHRLPGLHVGGGRRRPAPHPVRGPRERGRAPGPGLHRRLRAGRRRDLGSRRPDHRVALGRVGPRPGRRARRGRGPGLPRRGRGAGPQALPGARFGARRQPPGRCRSSRGPCAPCAGSTWCRSAPGSRRASRP